MKKVFLLALSFTASLCLGAARTTVEVFSSGRYTVNDHFTVVACETPEIRQDLLAGTMPAQPFIPAGAVSVTRDQRPLLQMFTLPRNDFAY
jgi:hypothetical protein